MLFITNNKGQKIYFDAEESHFINNYKIYYLIDKEIFYIINIKYKDVNGFIINDKKAMSEKGYYYYNLFYNKVYYLNNMKNDYYHHCNTKDMKCKTIEILEKDKIKKFKNLVC